MKFKEKMAFTAQQIAALVQGEIVGNPNETINTFAKIEEGVKGAVSFLADMKYEQHLYNTQSSVVLVNKSFEFAQPVSATLIKVDNAYEAIAKLLTFYESTKQRKTGLSDKACIAQSAQIGEDCYVAPFAYIGENVKIGKGCSLYPGCVVEDGVTLGDNCTLFPNVTIYQGCILGNRVIVHAGAVIGADGFGFAPTKNGYEKIPQIGIVTIEDDVEIGANTCIDRSTMGSTIIHKGVKLDNLVQIAHNVVVGSNTVMSAQVGVAGSTKIGEWCMLGGQVGVAGHIELGDKVYAGAQSGLPGGRLLKKGNVTVMGYPALEHQNFARSSAVYKNLPEMFRELNELKRELKDLKASLENKD